MVPPFWFDSCMNRDPCYYVAPHYKLVAISPRAPRDLLFRPNSRMSKEEEFLLQNVSEFLISEQVFIGKTENEYFVVDRKTNTYDIYDTKNQRNELLRKKYNLKETELKRVPWYARLRGNCFFPFNYIYYLGVIFIVLLKLGIERNKN